MTDLDELYKEAHGDLIDFACQEARRGREVVGEIRKNSIDYDKWMQKYSPVSVPIGTVRVTHHEPVRFDPLTRDLSRVKDNRIWSEIRLPCQESFDGQHFCGDCDCQMAYIVSGKRQDATALYVTEKPFKKGLEVSVL